MQSFLQIRNTFRITRLPQLPNPFVNARRPSSMFLYSLKCSNNCYYTTQSNQPQNLSLEKGNQLIEPWLKTLGLPEEEAKNLTSKLAKQAYQTKQDLDKAVPSNEQLERLGIPLRWAIIILKALTVQGKYIFPRFTQEMTNIPYCTLLKFTGESQPNAGFYLDTSDIVQKCTDWVKLVKEYSTKDPQKHLPPLVISGFQKTGKSTTLSYVLPAIIYSQWKEEKQVQVCQLDFESYQRKNFLGFLEDFRRTLYDWADLHLVPYEKIYNSGVANVKGDINLLLDAIDSQGISTFFLVDEVQRFFQHDTQQVDSNLPWFKSVVFSYRRRHLFWALTGSGMVTAFNYFWKLPSNGARFLSDVKICDLQPNLRIEVATYFITLAKQHYGVTFPQVLISESTEPAMLHLLCQRYAREHPKDPVTLLNEIENKAYDEFFQDIIPIISSDSGHNNEDRKQLRYATLGICELSLDTFLGAPTTEFFKPFVNKYDNTNQNLRHTLWENELALLNNPVKLSLPIQTWGIKQSIFSTFVQRVVAPDGKLKQLNYLRFHNGLFLTMTQLAILGEQINTLRKLSIGNQLDPDQTTLLQKTDQIISDFFQKHSLKAADYIKRLENFRYKHPHPTPQNQKPNYAGLSVNVLWLREWRNTFIHTYTLNDPTENLLAELSNELPPHITDVKQDLQGLFPGFFF